MEPVLAVLGSVVAASLAWGAWPSIVDALGALRQAAQRGRDGRIVPRGGDIPNDLPTRPAWLSPELCDAVVLVQRPGGPYRASGEARAVALTTSTLGRALGPAIASWIRALGAPVRVAVGALCCFALLLVAVVAVLVPLLALGTTGIAILAALTQH